MENDFLMIDRIKLYLKEYSVLKSGYTLIIKKYRNEDSMKIAVAYENGNVLNISDIQDNLRFMKQMDRTLLKKKL